MIREKGLWFLLVLFPWQIRKAAIPNGAAGAHYSLRESLQAKMSKDLLLKEWSGTLSIPISQRLTYI